MQLYIIYVVKFFSKSFQRYEKDEMERLFFVS